MNSWVKFSLKNAGVIIIGMIMVIVGGIYSASSMKMEEMPNVDIPYMYVEVAYPGATPEQSLEDVGKPLEQGLSSLDQLNNLYIEAHNNYAFAIMEFDMKKSMEEAEKDVNSKLAAIDLPEGAEKPEVFKDGPSAAPIYSFAVSGDEQQSNLQQYVNEEIKPLFSSIEGIASVDVRGSSEKKLFIKLDPEKLQEKNLTMDTIKQTLMANNISIPAGEITLNEKTMNIEASHQIQSVEQLKDTNISAMSSQGKLQTVKLSEIADISYEVGNEKVLTRYNDKPAVLVEVKAQPGSNAVNIVKEIKSELDNFPLNSDYELSNLYDSSVQVKKSVDSMLREVLLGTLFAVIVTFAFLRNIRSTLVAVLSIPLSIFASLMTMQWLGYSLNMMTLAGIAVAVGRVIDDSIVVIENVYRRTLTSKIRNSNLILEATKEVGNAITSSTLTTMAVFLPLSFVPGIVGKFFAPFGITVVIALAFSLIVAVTVVPLLAKLFFPGIKHHEAKENFLQRSYRTLLSWSLNHKIVIMLLALLVFGGSLALIPAIPKNFLPSEKAVSYQLSTSMPVGTSVEKANNTAKKIESILKDENEVKDYRTIVTGENVSFQITLDEEATKEAVKDFEKSIEDQTTELGKGIESALTPIGVTGTGGFMVVVNGGKGELEKGANQIVKEVEKVDGLTNIQTNLTAVKPQLSLDIDDQKAAEKGLTPAMVAAQVRELIAGNSIMEVAIDDRTTEVNLGLKVDDLDSISEIEKQEIATPTGEKIKLSDVATLTEEPGPTAINRLNQKEYVQITARMTSDNQSGIQADVEKRLSKLDLPEGVTYSFEGSAKAMNEGFRNMLIAMAVAVALVFIVMMIAFGELIAPLAILFSLPFIFTGGLLGLYITNGTLGMPALVGFLMLIGIVVTNAIVLVDRILQNQKEGMRISEAIIEAGSTRIRPILMTALATIGALTPLALSSDGGIISKALAIVVISGLLTSTLLTLVIVPVAYKILYAMREFSRRKGKKREEKLQIEKSA
ncbi:efflux RND transporter permease subunit [Pseudalkalibacillus caeni]|uniref:Efflux RND transporter permease subunit n=1 Tax=Exobacillus caeni TaxID=2574798 RepID=A0A5R9F873_9BACL|nr:efflux RND transporter permease subunit [Pseudalkalibacillus caeni]TLS38450.1 efflux RND transporter permease subunit [Pseudalkalibacillus caeni]